MSRYLFSRTLAKARRTSGDLTLNSTSWANVDTGLDLTLEGVSVDDEILFGISALAGNEGVDLMLDVVTIVSASPVNSFAEQGAAVSSPGARVPAWFGRASNFVNIGGYGPPFTVAAGDLDGADLTLRLRYATSTASNKTLRAGSSDPLDVWAWNIGPKQGA